MKIDLLPLCGVVLAAWPVVAQAENTIEEKIQAAIEKLKSPTDPNPEICGRSISCYMWKDDTGKKGGRAIADCLWGVYGFFKIATVQDVQACLDAGTDPNARDEHGETPLIKAVNWGFNGDGHNPEYLEIVKVLLDAGADPNAQGYSGRSALHAAAEWGLDRTVKVLLDAGADPNVQEEDGDTPLKKTAGFTGRLLGRDTEAVRSLLLDRGAKPDERWDCSGHWPDLYDLTLTAVGDIGIVAVDGFPDQTTVFSVGSFELRWDWCLDETDDRYKCSFVIEPGNRGYYYKFLDGEKTAKPKSSHTCAKAD